MFHYRWAHEADYKNAGPLLKYWGSSVMDDETAKAMSDHITKRQIDRLYVVESNDVTAPVIEAAYRRRDCCHIDKSSQWLFWAFFAA